MNKTIKSAIFIVLLCALTVATSYIFRFLAIESVKQLNRSMLPKEVETALTAFSRRNEAIQQINKDWAQWDDSYNFIQGKQPEYEEINLVDETLQTANLNMILFFDRDGYLVYKKSGSLGGLGDTSIPSEVFNYTTNNNKIDIKGIISSGIQQSGFLSANDGTFVYAVAPIVPSNGEGPAMGALMMARYINNTDLEELRKSTGYTMDFIRLDQLGGKFYPGLTLDQLKKGNVIKDEGDHFSVYTLAKDSWGNPALVISITHELLAKPNAIQLSQILTVVSVLLSACFAALMLTILPGRCFCPVEKPAKK